MTAPPAKGRAEPRLDAAVMTHRKPESLIYTLLTLHRHCRDEIGTVWIGDDGSSAADWALLSDPRLAARLAPWTVRLFRTRRWGGWSETLVTAAMARRMLNPLARMPLCDRLRMLRGLFRRGLRPAGDIRYERALAGTTAEAVLILHDDVEVRGNIARHYLDVLDKDPRLAIVGQLGQCWRCGEAGHCSPAEVAAGKRPTAHWPRTAPPVARRMCRFDRACRINEWCCMIRTSAARDLARDHIHFGNSEGGGDTGAYWFGAAVARGWGFADPFIGTYPNKLFLHGWQGHMGHQVWTDRSLSYGAQAVRDRLAADFGYDFSPRPPEP